MNADRLTDLLTQADIYLAVIAVLLSWILLVLIGIWLNTRKGDRGNGPQAPSQR